MTPYDHPQVNLDIFQLRLSTDIGVDNNTYQIQCSVPTPTSELLSLQSECAGSFAAYNTVVDMAATGGVTGEVDQYPYDRLDLSTLAAVLTAKGIDASQPFLKGVAVTTQDLVEVINDRWGASFDVTDIQPIALSECDCDCVASNGGIGVALKANPLSLIYTGQMTIYVMPSASLLNVIQQPYIASLGLPPVTP